MIAVIEQQRVQRRKPAGERKGGAKILEFTYPGTRRTQPIKRDSWRTAQQIRRPTREHAPLSRTIPRDNKPVPRQLPAVGKIPAAIGGLLKEMPRTHLLLAAVLAASLSIPLGFRLSILPHPQGTIDLPVIED